MRLLTAWLHYVPIALVLPTLVSSKQNALPSATSVIASLKHKARARFVMLLPAMSRLEGCRYAGDCLNSVGKTTSYICQVGKQPTEGLEVSQSENGFQQNKNA